VNGQLITAAVLLVFAAGLVDAFRIYLRVFSRYGGFESPFLSHIAASMIGFLRFLPYFLLAAVVLALKT
jgi:hypothetical protein